MDKIVVRWTEGRSKGTTSVVKRSAVKSRQISVRKVSVQWGKAKKVYNAEVADDGSVTAPQQVNSSEEEPLVFELAEPAQTEHSTDPSRPPPHEDRQPALITMMEHITDVVSGTEAKIEMVESLTNVVTEMQTKMLHSFKL